MAQLAPVELPEDTWVNVYTTTGIAVGTQLIIQNNGTNNVILVDSATSPANGTGFNTIEPYQFLTTASTPDGVWAKSSRTTRIQVEEA